MSESAVANRTSAGVEPKLGLFDATMLVAGSMIGSGIFIVSAEISRDVGSSGWLLLVWVLTGVLTIVGALSYAELASMMPNAGGQYVFLREAYGPLPAFLSGWTCFLVIQTGFIAAVSVAFARYFGVLLPVLAPFEKYVAASLTIALSVVNSFGVEPGRWVQNIFTVSKVLGLGFLIVLGLTVAADPRAIEQNTHDVWSGITTTQTFAEVENVIPWQPVVIVMVLSGAMVGSLFSSDAWNNVTFVAHEVKNPHRTLPWALFYGTAIVVVLYILANVAYLTALPLRGQKDVPASAENPTFQRGIQYAEEERVGTAVLEEASPKFGVPLMAIIIMISTFGCVNGLTLMGPRLYYAMARDGLFFRWVGSLNRHGVPVAGLWLQCFWSITLIFSGTYGDLLDYIVFAALMFYVLTVAAVFILRAKKPTEPRPYRAWGYPVVPRLYIILCSIIMLSLLVVKPMYCWPSFIIVLAGIPVYFLWRLVNR